MIRKSSVSKCWSASESLGLPLSPLVSLFVSLPSDENSSLLGSESDFKPRTPSAVTSLAEKILLNRVLGELVQAQRRLGGGFRVGCGGGEGSLADSALPKKVR